MPHPVQQPHPPIVNAGISADPKEIIAEHCDWAFISMFSVESAQMTTVDIDVAVKLNALFDAGLDGVLMVFQAYHRDTLRFQHDVMPLLREMRVIAA